MLVEEQLETVSLKIHEDHTIMRSQIVFHKNDNYDIPKGPSCSL